MTLLSPFPYFGGKRSVAADVWLRFGSPKQYIEPFCGSAAVLLSSPNKASLEVINDASGFIANFWRAVKHQAPAVAEWADYPVSHVDLGARHVWLMEKRDEVATGLHDPDWPGDAKVAGWWLWGQCCWIGDGWCKWTGQVPHVSNAGMGVQAIGKVPHISDAGRGVQAIGQVPHVSNAGMGVQAIGKVPHISDAGMGVQAIGQVPHVSDAGMGVQAIGKVPHVSDAGMGSPILTSAGRVAMAWLGRLADRLERVRVVHGDWSRCLNNHYGGDDVAVFLDPPYRSYEATYGVGNRVADAVEAWARDNAHLRIALCGHRDDYSLDGWDVVEWSRKALTYGGGQTTDKECVWYSPACLSVVKVQMDLFAEYKAAR